MSQASVKIERKYRYLTLCTLGSAPVGGGRGVVTSVPNLRGVITSEHRGGIPSVTPKLGPLDGAL